MKIHRLEGLDPAARRPVPAQGRGGGVQDAAIGREGLQAAARAAGAHESSEVRRPQLAVDWETFLRAPRVLIRLKAHNLPQRPPRSMTLRVYGIAIGQPTRVLAEWALAPDAEGVFDRRLSVVVGHGFSDVCIVASITTRQPTCPPPVEDGTVWTQLAVPPA